MFKYLLWAGLVALTGIAYFAAQPKSSPWENAAQPIAPEKHFILTGETGNQTLEVTGYWDTQKGYVHTPWNATAIICDKLIGFCSESISTLLRHDDGEDLEAEAVLYRIDHWDQNEVSITGRWRECIERKVKIDLVTQQATMTWAGTSQCEDAGPGKATLSGS